jgi:hypothetical protein
MHVSNCDAEFGSIRERIAVFGTLMTFKKRENGISTAPTTN